MREGSFPLSVEHYRSMAIAIAITVLLPVVAAAQVRTISSTGTLNPVSTVTVGSFVSGVVRDVSCDFNATVKKGQVCARIDPRPYQTAVDQARAALANARAQLEQHNAGLAYVKASFERSSTLVQRGVVSKDAFENVQSNFGQARAQIEVDRTAIAQRQAELDTAELNLAYTFIASPLDGVVLTRSVAAGETISTNYQVPNLFVIGSDLKRLQLLATVGESDIAAVKEGDGAIFTVKAFPGKSFRAKVLQIRHAPEVQGIAVSYGVVLEVDNPDLQLKPGMTATVKITTAN